MLRALIRSLSNIQVSSTTQTLKRIESLSKIQNFTLEECKNEIVSNWQNKKLSFLSGIKVSEQELEMLLKIADCLKPEELKGVSIPIPVRKEICTILGVDMWEVTKFIILQKTHKKMHDYLIGRLKRNESLPKSEDEIKKMMLNDPLPRTKSSVFLIKRRQKYSKKQFKYGMDKKHHK